MPIDAEVMLSEILVGALFTVILQVAVLSLLVFAVIIVVPIFLPIILPFESIAAIFLLLAVNVISPGETLLLF